MIIVVILMTIVGLWICMWLTHIAMTLEEYSSLSSLLLAWKAAKATLFKFNIFNILTLLNYLKDHLYISPDFRGSLFYGFLTEKEVKDWVIKHSSTHKEYMDSNIWEDMEYHFSWHAWVFKVEGVFYLLDPISFLWMVFCGNVLYNKKRKELGKNLEKREEIFIWQQSAPKLCYKEQNI